MRSPSGRPVRPLRLTANLFGLAFGLCGLAQCWSVANLLAGVPAWPADILWVLAGLAWLITLIGYAGNVIATGRLRTELSDPIFAPFTSLIVMVPMLLGVALATIQPAAGEVGARYCHRARSRSWQLPLAGPGPTGSRLGFDCRRDDPAGGVGIGGQSFDRCRSPSGPRTVQDEPFINQGVAT